MTTGEQLRRRVWISDKGPQAGKDLEPEYVDRYCRAPQPKPVILVLQSKYYIGVNPADLWGSKVAISHADLRALIDRLTCQPWPFPAAQDVAGEKTAVRLVSAGAERANRRERAMEWNRPWRTL